jgi:type IV secretion system protein VirD4
MLGNGIILGRKSADNPSFGFDRDVPSSGDLIRYTGDAPITVIAPTGSGKGRDFLVPLLLTDDSPAIVVDIKGELSAICGRRRQEMGHRLCVVDPFKVTGYQGDRLNPLDLFGLKGSQIDCDAEMIASQLSSGHEFKSDPFWADCGSGLLAGLIAYAASGPPQIKRSMESVRKELFGDDTDYRLSLMLETIGQRISPFAYAEINSYLQICSDKTRPSVLSTARTFMKSLNSASVAECMEDPTIDLQEVVDGAPIDIFITIPPEKLISHAGFLKVMIGTMLTAIMRRKDIPDRRTLMVIDEAAQLGAEFGPLLTATTLMRGYGLQLVTAWQDVAQIRSRFKTDWSTILNGSGAVLTFGIGHFAGAKDAGEFLGIEPFELMRMARDEAALAVRGEGTRRIKRVNYLEDEMFAGMADVNPYHARRNRSGKAI